MVNAAMLTKKNFLSIWDSINIGCFWKKHKQNMLKQHKRVSFSICIGTSSQFTPYNFWIVISGAVGENCYLWNNISQLILALQGAMLLFLFTQIELKRATYPKSLPGLEKFASIRKPLHSYFLEINTLNEAWILASYSWLRKF